MAGNALCTLYRFLNISLFVLVFLHQFSLQMYYPEFHYLQSTCVTSCRLKTRTLSALYFTEILALTPVIFFRGSPLNYDFACGIELQIVGISVFCSLVASFYCFLGIFLSNRIAEITLITVFSFAVLFTFLSILFDSINF